MDKFHTLKNLLGSTDIKGALFDPNTQKKKKQQRYDNLMKGINVYSHSTSERLITCERKFACSKLTANAAIEIDPVFRFEQNIDFAFGRAIETGVQAALLNHNKQQVFFDMFRAWDMPLMTQHPKNYAKTFTDAVIAIDQFQQIRRDLLAGWEVAMFNKKPAIELSLLIDLENGYYYVGHADLILFNPTLRRYRVLEIKTTGSKNVNPAMYKNSGQGTGYSVFLDEIARDVELTSTFEIYYLVWPTSVGFWTLYDFTKSRSDRAGWLNTMLLDIQRIDTYRKHNFFPKRGSACFDFYRACQFYESCDLDPTAFNPTGEFAVISAEEIAKHEFDFRFKPSDILKTQKELIA